MAITRRDFLKYTAVMGGGLLLASLFDLAPVKAYAEANPPVWTAEENSICCYCGVGCGIIVGTKVDSPYVDSSTSEHVTYVQGDPDHPINRGVLCSKGSGMAQLRTVNGALNPRRLTGIKYRRPNASDWDQDGSGNDKLYGWNDTITPDSGPPGTVLDLIVNRIRSTRDTKAWDASGMDPNPGYPQTVTRENIDGAPTPVNRCTGIANFGGAAHDNEECYLLSKLMRALGLVYIEHQARI